MKKILMLVLTIPLLSFAASLPKNIKWLTNNKDPVWSSKDAVKGGSFRLSILSFPMTLRTVGPDSNGSTRSLILDNNLDLVGIHPETDKIIPLLATHWAFAKDGKTVFYKLNKKALWSDGHPVTSADFVFSLKMMRSKFIVAPWYNKHYTENIINVKVYSDHIISIEGALKKPKNDLVYNYGVSPSPKHFYKKISKDFVKKYNWEIIPNTGAYQISSLKKGKSLTFSRKKSWWAKNLRYNQNRYNVDKVKVSIIRDPNVGYQHFLKGKIDSYSIVLPEYWHKKAKGKFYDNGLIHKIWFYNDVPQPEYGLYLNQSIELFKDKNIRKAFSHAMNIEKVLKKVLHGDYLRLNTTSVGYGGYTNSKIKARSYDLKKAASYLKKAGWIKRGKDGILVKKGKRLSVTMTYGSPHHTPRLVVLKEDAKKAGIELRLQLLDGAASFKFMLEKKHQMASLGWGAQYRPQFWGQWHSDNANKPQTNNFTNTSSKKMDQLIEKFRKSVSTQKREKLSRDIQQFIYDEAAFIPTWKIPYFRTAFWNYWKFPKGYATKKSKSLMDPFTLFGATFWLDQEKKKITIKARRSHQKFPKTTIIETKYK